MLASRQEGPPISNVPICGVQSHLPNGVQEVKYNLIIELVLVLDHRTASKLLTGQLHSSQFNELCWFDAR